MDFFETFKSPGAKKSGDSPKDNFLARLFGLFSEEIIRIAYKKGKSKKNFTYLGRPTIYKKSEYGVKGARGDTVDFLLEDVDGNIFVTEMKCELTFDDYRCIELVNERPIERHRKNKPAFKELLDLGKSIKDGRGELDYVITYTDCAGNRGCIANSNRVAGIALVWGKVAQTGLEHLKEKYNITHIISLEDVMNDLIKNENEDYLELIQVRQSWCDSLFEHMR